MNNKTYKVAEGSTGKRLDVFLSEQLQISRAQAQKYIKNAAVLVNGMVKKKSSVQVSLGEEILVKELEVKKTKRKEKTEEQALPTIEILKETETYLVINKPAGFLVHPTQAAETNTITNWLVKMYPSIKTVGDSTERPGIVHRLDKDASGVLVIAKTQQMFEHLKKQFQQRTVEKIYTVLVHGGMEQDEHVILDFPIDRGTDGRMVSRPKTGELSLKSVQKIQPGKEAKTEVWVEKTWINHALLKVKIHTGRTHQIRVHMFAYDHPVVGDPLYMHKKFRNVKGQDLGRLFLHAKKLCFQDLEDNQVCVETILPESLQTFLNTLDKK